jgi:hypothetical protein
VGTGKKNNKKHAHPNRCAYSLFRVMPFDLIESFIQTAGEVTGGIEEGVNEWRLNVRY